MAARSSSCKPAPASPLPESPGPPTVPAASAGPLTGVGTVVYHPAGTFLLTAQRSVNGVIDPQPLELRGMYTLNPQDCTLRMNFEVGFTFNGALINGGRAISFIETDPGTTLLIRAQRI